MKQPNKRKHRRKLNRLLREMEIRELNTAPVEIKKQKAIDKVLITVSKGSAKLAKAMHKSILKDTSALQHRKPIRKTVPDGEGGYYNVEIYPIDCDRDDLENLSVKIKADQLKPKTWFFITRVQNRRVDSWVRRSSENIDKRLIERVKHEAPVPQYLVLRAIKYYIRTIEHRTTIDPLKK